MRVDEIQTLFNYHDWATDRILARATQLDPPAPDEPAALCHRTLKATLVHILNSEMVWRNRCEGFSPLYVLDPSSFDGLAAVQTLWEREREAMFQYLSSLSDNDLDDPISYTTTAGFARSDILWQILFHVVNHGTYHRSEAAQFLTERNLSPGDIDLIVFLRATRPPVA